MRINLRIRLALSFLLVVLITAFLSVLLGYKLIFNNIIGQAYSNVLGQMNTAQYIYNDRINVIRLFMEHLSGLDYIAEAILENDRALLYKKLVETRAELSLDVLNLAEPSGRILVRAGDPDAAGQSVAGDDFIRKILEERRSLAGTDEMTPDELLAEGEQLAKKAHIRLIATPRAQVTGRQVEERGIVLKAGAPIVHQGHLIGVIYGARLLNNDTEFVDRIKTFVFQGEQFEGRDVGTATIFLDDVRVSTNVTLADGSRALGTQVSEEVYEKVVRQKGTWLDQAFVVNSWYFSAYRPILDIHDEVIGILYVGILKDKYDELKFSTAVFYGLIILLSGSIGVLFSLYFIRNIVAPYRSLTEAARVIAGGDYSHKIEGEFGDEVGSLADGFNQMKSVINNLAVNAADAMADGGTLTVSTTYDSDRETLAMVFEDTGTGIPPEHMERIFDPFFTTKAPGKGTGLGMTVTYGIVKRHGGSIALESKLGQGTRVRISLPKDTPSDRKTQQPSLAAEFESVL